MTKKHKKLVLIGAILLAFAVSVGTYASATLTNSVTVAASVAGTQIATTNTSASQPDWVSLTPFSTGGLETIRPDGPGDLTNIGFQQPTSGSHWQKVADVSPDEFATTVYEDKGSYKMDLYNLQDHTGYGSISSVTVYYRFTATSGGTAYAQPAIKTGGNIYLGTQEIQAGPTFATKSYTWESNPATSTLWSWTDIDDLQAGIQIYRIGANKQAVVTQLYVVVDYLTRPITQGDVPTGNLFTVTPNTSYSGDLAVKIYLANTGALTKAYRYLNVKVYASNSLEAGQTPNYQVLSLDNGVVTFNIAGGTAPSYMVSVTGGSYNLLSGDSTQWAPGWSLTPELYIEVTPR